MNTRKLVSLKKCLILILVLCVVAFVGYNYGTSDKRQTTITGTGLETVAVFFIDDELYSIMRNGNLVEYQSMEKRIIHEFPTAHVVLDTEENKFYYLKDNYLYAFSLYDRKTEKIAEIQYNTRNNRHDGVLFFVDDNIFMQLDESLCKKYSLTTEILSDVPDALTNYVTVDGDQVIYYNENKLFCYDVQCDNEYLVAENNSGKVITAACISKGNLYYSCSDGILRCASMHSEAENSSESFKYNYEKMGSGKVIALQSIEGGMIAVRSDKSGNHFRV